MYPLSEIGGGKENSPLGSNTKRSRDIEDDYEEDLQDDDEVSLNFMLT